MIVSFKSPDTEALAKGNRVRRFANIESVARRKVRQLQIAGRLFDDATVLRVGDAYEKATPWRQQRPVLAVRETA